MTWPDCSANGPLWGELWPVGKGKPMATFSPFVAIYRLEKEHTVSLKMSSEIRKSTVQVDTLHLRVETSKGLGYWMLYGKGSRRFDE